jgi:hypothetical protein
MKKYFIFCFFFTIIDNKTEKSDYSFQSIYQKITQFFFKNEKKEKKTENSFSEINIKESNLINEEYKNNEITKINIFIHGSVSSPEGYSNKKEAKGNWVAFWRAFSEQWNTEKSIAYNLKHRFAKRKNREKLFHEDKLPLFMGIEPGLHKIKENNITPTAWEKIYQKLDHNKHTAFYIFNWDGDVSEQSRIFFAHMLSKEIKKMPKNIEINLYCHSHGGNLALHAIKDVKIHHIYLLGTPIGKKTEEIISIIPQENYNGIYNFYSIDDKTQVKDIFFDLGFLPGRIIENASKKNIYNIEIKLEKERKINHKDFYVYDQSKKEHIPLFLLIETLPTDFTKNNNHDMKNMIITLDEKNNIQLIQENLASLKKLSYKKLLNVYIE